MKKILKNSINKRKSVNEKANANSTSSSSKSGSGRTSSRSNTRALRIASRSDDAENASGTINNDSSGSLNNNNSNGTNGSTTPTFARQQSHPYNNLKSGYRDSKTGSSYMESRHSMDSNAFDNISEYSQNENNYGIEEEPVIPEMVEVGEHSANGSSHDLVKPGVSNLSEEELIDSIDDDSVQEQKLAQQQSQHVSQSITSDSNGTSNPIPSNSTGSSNSNKSTHNDASNSDQAADSKEAHKSVVEEDTEQTHQTYPSAPKLINSGFTPMETTPEESNVSTQVEKGTATAASAHTTSATATTSGSSSVPQPISQSQHRSKVSKKNIDFDYDSTVFKLGWVNKATGLSSAWNADVNPETWKLYRAELKGDSLNLYKVPQELGIKHFVNRSADADKISPVSTMVDSEVSHDPSTISGEDTTTFGGASSVTITKNGGSSNINTPNANSDIVNVSYVSEVYPHPDLQFDEGGDTILNGTLEAVCHSVLFNTSDDQRLSAQLITVIPLFGGMNMAISYFIQYAVIFLSESSLASFKKNSHSFKFPLSPSVLKQKNIIISDTTDCIITSRLSLVVQTIQEQFPGMLLEQIIFEKLLKLLELISIHDEDLSKDLTQKVISKQHSMTELLSFDNSLNSRALMSKEETSISAERFLKINLDEFSDQINLIDLKFNREWNPKTDASVLYETGFSYSRYNPLIFDPVSNVHYLGRLLTQHLFEDEESKRNTHFRAKLIQKWVELGSIFDRKGDMVGWLAIATVICSIPILRLRKTWTIVDSKTTKIVSLEWGQVVFELHRRNMTSDAAHKSSYHVIAPHGIGISYSKYRVVPYFGDLAVKLSNNITLKQCDKRVQRVKISFSRWDKYLESVVEVKDFGDLPAPIPSIQRLLYNLLNIHVSLPKLSHEDIMKLSLHIEPVTNFSLHQFYTELSYERPAIREGAFLPVLFTDIIPNYRLIDKNALIDVCCNNSKNRRNQIELATANAVTGINTIDVLSVNPHLKLKSNGPLSESVKDILNIDTNVFHIGNDLIFKAISSPIDTQGGHMHTDGSNSGLEENEKPLIVNVVAKAGSFEKLVDILVLTPNIFNALIDEDDILAYKKKYDIVGRSIKLDMDITVYTETFFASYKSFCTLNSLLAALARRFVGAKGAAISVKKMKELKEGSKMKPTLNWDANVDSSADINWKYVAQIEAGILEALYALISEFYPDFTDDLSTKDAIVDILKLIDQQVVVEWKNVLKQHSNGNDELFELYENSQLLYKKIRRFYIKRSYRPLDAFPSPHPFSSIIDFPPEIAHIPELSQFAEIQQLIARLDVVVYDLFKLTTVNDWMFVLDLFEMQNSRSLLGMFSYRQPSPAISEEDLKLFNVFSWLETLHIDTPDNKLLSRLPAHIRALYGLHGKITSYFLNQIIEPKLPIVKRRNRMTSILQMLAIIRCRMRNCTVFAKNSSSDKKPVRIPAFLESCIAMAICSPESRWFVNDWIYASVKLHTKESLVKWETLEDLVPEFDSKILLKEFKTPVTPCIGWFIERLLEIGCYLPNVSVENPVLINFDKRRYSYKLISLVQGIKTEETSFSSEEVEEIKKRFEFLYNIKRSVYDLRDIREAARKENKDYSRNEQKNKLFTKLVSEEFDKLKRDVKKKEQLDLSEKQRKRNNPPSTLSSSVSSVSITTQEPVESAPTFVAHSKDIGGGSSTFGGTSGQNLQLPKGSSRFKLGGIFNKVGRPFSINVTPSWSAPEKVVAVSDLPDVKNFDKLAKPTFNHKVSHLKPLLIHSDIAGFFKVVDDGHEYCYQALDDQDAQDWVHKINESKRLSYLSGNSKDKNSSKVFGVPIQIVCEKEGNSVPYVVDRLLSEIELRGLDEVGIYRVPGAVANIQQLKQLFDEHQEVSLDDQRWLEINTLAGCFKLYIRELPESLLTSELLPEFVAATSKEDVTGSVAELIGKLPFHNYHLLKRLVSHLKQVTEHSAKNRMDAFNLAMVFSMSFLSASDTDFTKSLGSLQSILCMMIQKPEDFFTEKS